MRYLPNDRWRALHKPAALLLSLAALMAGCGDDSEDAVHPEHDSEYCQLARELREPESGPRSEMSDEDRGALLVAAPEEIRDHLISALAAVDELGGNAYFDNESYAHIKAVDDYDVSVCGVPPLEERMAESEGEG